MQPSQPPTQTSQPGKTDPMTGNKKRFFVATLLLLVLLSAVLVIRDNNQTEQTTNQASQLAEQSVLITISNEGFSPATVTIKKNQNVEWINVDDAQHQIASDPHPTDDSLESLNDDIPLEKDDSFSYVFDKAGTYTYHDEFNPLKFNGTVIVEE